MTNRWFSLFANKTNTKIEKKRKSFTFLCKKTENKYIHKHLSIINIYKIYKYLHAYIKKLGIEQNRKENLTNNKKGEKKYIIL